MHGGNPDLQKIEYLKKSFYLKNKNAKTIWK
jgi:hypothetical protein